MIVLCATAVLAALAGLASIVLALGSAVGLAFLAAPAFGTVSLVTGAAAAIVALRRADSAI
jgi:hypothetical protein